MIGPGDRMPDVVLADDRGEAWSPAGPRDRPLVLVLHRHFY